jgi:hypothetical protein
MSEVPGCAWGATLGAIDESDGPGSRQKCELGSPASYPVRARVHHPGHPHRVGPNRREHRDIGDKEDDP